MTVFYSTIRNHKLIITPTWQDIINGFPKVHYGRKIKFDEHSRYETSDKDEIDFIRKSMDYGVRIFEDQSKPVEKEKIEHETNERRKVLATQTKEKAETTASSKKR